MSHPLIKSVALACIAVASVSAQADNVSFAGFANGKETVNIVLSAPDAPTSISNGNAGGFTTSLNGGASFTTFCVDLYQNLGFNNNYSGYSLVDGSAYSFANANANTDLGKLFSEHNVLNSDVKEAAFQIAVWEIVYERSGTYNLATGSAKFSGGTAASDGSPTALAYATTWLNALAATPDGYDIKVLKSAEQQDVIFAAPVPEPTTYALLAGGLLAVGFVSRRRAQK
jgi:hypothetical protein